MLADAVVVSNVEQLSKPESSLEVEEQYNFKEDLKKYLETMSAVQIKNQVQQILNYSDNLTGQTEYDLASLVANFCIILSENTENREFKASLNRSLECLVDFDILGRLDELKAGDNNSFLQVPVFAEGHLFGCIIYRMDEDNFEFVLVNKGYRTKLNGEGWHDTCEAYMVPKSNLRYLIDNCLTQLDVKGVLGTEEVYDAFEKKGVRVVDTGFNQDDGYLFYSDIELMDQKKGNCFYKNEEAALLFAWKNAMGENNFSKTKSSLSTADVHVRYVENLRRVINENWNDYTEKKDILKFLDDAQNIYLKSKEFREYYKEHYYDTDEEKRIETIHIFLGDDREYLRNLPSNFLEKKLDDSLGMMDLQTLITHVDIIELSKNKDIFRDLILFAYGLNDLNSDNISTMGELYVEFRNKYRNIAKTPFSQLDLMYADELEKVAFFGGEDMVRRILQLNEDSLLGNLLMGIISEDNKYIDKAVNMMPNFGYMIDLKLGFDDSVDYNLYDYIKSIDSNLRRNSNDFNLKYSMVMLKNWLLYDVDNEKIEHLYLEEVNKEEKDAITYFNIGVYSWNLEHFDEARENFEKASNINTKYKLMYSAFLRDSGEKEEALSKLGEILEEDPSNLEALMYRLATLSDILEDRQLWGSEKKDEKELVTKAIADSTKSMDLLYRDTEGYLYRIAFNKYAHENGLDILDARENALEDCRKLYNLSESYQGTAIWNIYSLGEIEEAFVKCTQCTEWDGFFYEWMMLWDLSYRMEDDENLAQEVEGILRKVININNVKDYNLLRGFFADMEDNTMSTILDNVLKDFLNR